MASNSDRRLDRLFLALSARERALLILRHYKDGKEPPRSVMSTAPSQQVGELNRLIGLMNAVNCELTFGLMTICAQVKQVEIKHAWLTSMALCIDEAESFGHGVLARVEDAKLKREIKKLMAGLPGQVELPIETGGDERKDGEHSIDWLLRSLVGAIKSGAEQNWRELRAIEIAIDEVAEDFSCEDPLKPDGRTMLEDAKARCQQLREDIRFYVEPFDLPEPSEAEVELVRKLIAQAGKT